MRAERLVLLGAPAAGKGTQVERLRERFGFSVASTGQMLRDEEQLGTEVGRLSKELSKSGTLVPDAIVLNLMEAWLGKNCSAVL
ncbi:MAG: nucleoside monophosphate kinase, partial [Verrucomicrobiales bacterium]|nr:nucleoside monophosphate kinase [Verrucomicrobiales bacterium]